MQQVKTKVWRVYGGQTNLMMELYNAAEVDQELSDQYLSKGWELFNTHLGGFSDGGITMVYILVKKE